jgi:glycosyltransferase involved in cell wall biosynthesis
MLLPYRLMSYRLRDSRVAIEAMVNGIPCIVTRGTTFAQQLSEFGAGVECEEADADNLALAIEEVSARYPQLSAQARAAASRAEAHFSVRQFRESLLAQQTSKSANSYGDELK